MDSQTFHSTRGAWPQIPRAKPASLTGGRDKFAASIIRILKPSHRWRAPLAGPVSRSIAKTVRIPGQIGFGPYRWPRYDRHAIPKKALAPWQRQSFARHADRELL